jgi:hypothetical protein
LTPNPVHRLPIDGVDSVYRKQLLLTPPQQLDLIEGRKSESEQSEITVIKKCQGRRERGGGRGGGGEGHDGASLLKASKSLPEDPILLKEQLEDHLPLDTSHSVPSPGDDSQSSRTTSGGSKGTKSIFSYTEIERPDDVAHGGAGDEGGDEVYVKDEEESISFTIDGTVETENDDDHHHDDDDDEDHDELEEYHDQDRETRDDESRVKNHNPEDEKGEETSEGKEKKEMEESAALFHGRDYLVNQLFHEQRKKTTQQQQQQQPPQNEEMRVEKEETQEIETSPITRIPSSPHSQDTIKRARNGIYFYHPPMNSFRKSTTLSSMRTSLSPPPPPPFPPPSFSPSSSLSRFHSQISSPDAATSSSMLDIEEPPEDFLSTTPNEGWNDNDDPQDNLSLSSLTQTSVRTSTPSSSKSTQFRQYYQNFLKERKAKNLLS